MASNPPYMYQQPWKYSQVHITEKGFDPKAITRGSWTQKPTKTRPSAPYISAQDLNGQSNSYMVVPHSESDRKRLPKNTRSTVKWTRITLLILRICSWLGAAGLLACVVCVKPIGSTMDWVVRAPPAVALVHLTYAIYHLCRSARSKTPASSGSYMVFAAILDSCLILFQVLIAILARNQLLNALSDGTARWEIIFGNDFQRHTIIYSTFLLGLTTASLHLVGACVSLFLALKYRKIAQLPPDMNPLEDNLTARGHKKAKSSVSTFMTDSSTRNETTHLSNVSSQTVQPNHTRTIPTFSEHNTARRTNFENISTYSNLTKPSHRQTENLTQSHNRGQVHSASRNVPALYKSNKPFYSALSTDSENTDNRLPAQTDSAKLAPLELQHLRDPMYDFESLMPEPLFKPKYDFSNRSPRPLGLHPPTPREATPSSVSGFDVRVLRNIDGNSSAPRTSISIWRDTELDFDPLGDSPKGQVGKKQYGEMVSVGSVTRNQARVVSSGVDSERHSSGVRMREVSGKIVEEGRAGVSYTDF